MAYILPSPLVYQQLANAGGVANLSPDLNACIIGPCYNLVDYDASTAATLAVSRATSTGPGTGSPYTYNTGVTGTAANAYVNSVFPGQILQSSSVSVFFNNVSVETLVTGGFVVGTGNTMTLDLPVTVAGQVLTFTGWPTTMTSGMPDLVNFLSVGDKLVLSTAATPPATQAVTVASILNNTVTFTEALTIATPVTARKQITSTNTTSATQRIVIGNPVTLTNVGGGLIATSTVSAINTDSSGYVVSFSTADDFANFTGVLSVRQSYDSQLISPGWPPTAMIPTPQWTLDAETQSVSLGAIINVSYGKVIQADVHIQYSALREDLQADIQAITNADDIVGTLGKIDPRNPLALAVSLAKANTPTQVLAVGIPGTDLAAYLKGLDLVQDARVYSLVPLTQSQDILTSFKAHVLAVSTPERASWRMALVSTLIPTTVAVGQYNADSVNANSGNTLTQSNKTFFSPNSSFVNDGVVPGDVIVVTAVGGSSTAVGVGVYTVDQVVSNTRVIVKETVPGSSPLSAVSFWVRRNLTKTKQAEFVAAQSRGYGSSRVVNCPNVAGVVINGVTQYLPGYYFMAGAAGLIAGLASQYGLTNIALAGFSDVKMSNFYFTGPQMDIMAEAGTFLMVQQAPGSIPYVRHELTTDVSVLQYREIQQVKNWDYLSYFFYDILKNFVGTWNITPDTLNTLRQSLSAGGVLLTGRKLPKVGPPLVTFTILSVEQSKENLDQVIMKMNIVMPVPLNYPTLYLIV